MEVFEVAVKRKVGRPRGFHHTPEWKKQHSECLKGDIRMITNKGKHLSEETRRKIGMASKGRLKSDESRKKLSESLKGHIVSEEARKKMRLAKQGKYFGKNNPNYGKHHFVSEETRNKLRQKAKLRVGDKSPMYHKTFSLDHRKKISLSNKGKIRSHETIIKLKLARSKRVIPFKDTSIEVKIQNFLKELKIEFLTHYYIKEIAHNYRCDIFIPVQPGILQKTIIECDGDFFHGNIKIYKNPSNWQLERIEKDRIRTKELIEKGFRVIRLWENEIKIMNITNFQEKLKC